MQGFIWTLVIVFVSAAAYLPTLYGPTWGTLGDYGSAFVARLRRQAGNQLGASAGFRLPRLAWSAGGSGCTQPAVARDVVVDLPVVLSVLDARFARVDRLTALDKPSYDGVASAG